MFLQNKKKTRQKMNKCNKELEIGLRIETLKEILMKLGPNLSMLEEKRNIHPTLND